MNVPLCRPSITDDDVRAVSEVLRSGWLAHGAHNHAFEQAFSEVIGVPHAVSMNSCTSALEVALEAAGVTGEVVLPSFTWVASANAVVNVGATPVFCEVDPVTRNTTAELVTPHITSRTEAVMVVHFGGQPCPMDAMADLCRRKGLLLIEDSAETLGATWDGRQAGSFGVGCFSFFPTKNITTGEGGMLTCADDDLAARVRALIAHGLSTTTADREKLARPWQRSAGMSGHNFRMPNPLAALGHTQLSRLDAMNRRRGQLARRFDEALAPLAPRLRTPAVLPRATHVYQMYTVTVDPTVRDHLVLGLRDRGIGASGHFDPPVHRHRAYADTVDGAHLHATERLSASIISLPIFPDMTDEEQQAVITAVTDLVGDLDG